MPKVRDIISYDEMSRAEGKRLQKGMNFRKSGVSVLLMSLRRNAPYPDRLEGPDVLIYEGHNIGDVADGPDPKTVDQPLLKPNGRPSDNQLFLTAAAAAKRGETPYKVRVYEKLMTGVWSFAGTFHLIDAWEESDGVRRVFKFKLRMTDDLENRIRPEDLIHSRIIPSGVKAEVFARDEGRCKICGSQDNLHFDHVLPFSKGGTSVLAENVQILCARHNLEKRDSIA